MSPKLLLLDEPLCNLDAHLREAMQSEIKKLRDELDLTIVIVTHDMHEAERLADRVITL
jgi:iron(III) transport system ATP-binding protein